MTGYILLEIVSDQISVVPVPLYYVTAISVVLFIINLFLCREGAENDIKGLV